MGSLEKQLSKQAATAKAKTVARKARSQFADLLGDSQKVMSGLIGMVNRLPVWKRAWIAFLILIKRWK